MREQKLPLLADIFESLMSAKKQGWLYFGFFGFLVLFLGSHLAKAAIELSVPNIRTADIVYFGTAPSWFILFVLLKLAFWLFSVAYIVVFIKRRVQAKNA